MKKTSGASLHISALDRRTFLGAALGACVNTPLVTLSALQLSSRTGSLTKEEQDRMTRSQVIDELKKGNELTPFPIFFGAH
jgi:hypothetical protein